MILILGDVPVFTEAIKAKLAVDGIRYRHVTRNPHAHGGEPETVQNDLTSVRSVDHLRKKLEGQRIGGIVNLLPLESTYQDRLLATELVTTIFTIVQTFENDLRESATRGGGWLFNVTSIDGSFGLESINGNSIIAASTIGLFKSIQREWPDVRVTTVDIDPNASPDALIVGLGEELSSDNSDIEVCLSANSRKCLQLRSEVTESHTAFHLDSRSIVLVTGGAFGVTADVAKRMAQEYKPRLILVGRSEILESEPIETQEFGTESQLRQFFIRQMREKQMATPAEIERHVQRHLKSRAIRKNVEQMRLLGSQVDYHSVDVRDNHEFGALVDSVYQQFGRLDGVIHGAGVIEDNLIRDKSVDSFTRVFETKVKSAETLAQKLDPKTLRFLVFFSSVSGRFGNPGQVDYSAANEYLNKLAAQLDQRWPARVVSINWGPWDSGMVSDGLRELFNTKGIELIERDEGVNAFLDELRTTKSRVPEVILARTIREIANAGRHPGGP